MKTTFAANRTEMESTLALRAANARIIEPFTESHDHGLTWSPIFWISIDGERTDEKLAFNAMDSDSNFLSRRQAQKYAEAQIHAAYLKAQEERA